MFARKYYNKHNRARLLEESIKEEIEELAESIPITHLKKK